MTRRLKNNFMVLPKYWYRLGERRQLVAASIEALHGQALRADPTTPAAIKDFEAMVIDHMCPDLPAHLCTGDDGVSFREKTKANFLAMKGWTNAATVVLASQARGETPYVDQIEAERRGAICIECPKHTHGICTTCNGFRAVVMKLLLGRKTKYDNRLDVCAACGCMLTGKVWLTTPVLDEIDSRNKVMPTDYADRCWRRHTEP